MRSLPGTRDRLMEGPERDPKHEAQSWIKYSGDRKRLRRMNCGNSHNQSGHSHITLTRSIEPEKFLGLQVAHLRVITIRAFTCPFHIIVARILRERPSLQAEFTGDDIDTEDDSHC
jgi:hypothetical protein